MHSMSEVTCILSQIESADPVSAEELLPLVYDELRKLAAARLAHDRLGRTLQATALVHEAYLRLVGDTPGGQNWDSRGHFFAAAAEAMRRILVERARRIQTCKHGGQRQRISLDEVTLTVPGHDMESLLALNEALALLDVEDPAKAQLVKLRYFAGLTLEEAASVLGISVTTVKRHWIYARAWLYGKMTGP